MADIAVIDYGMGNLRSVQQALRTVAPAASIILTDDPHQVAQAQRVVFPGQNNAGSRRHCAQRLLHRTQVAHAKIGRAHV